MVCFFSPLILFVGGLEAKSSGWGWGGGGGGSGVWEHWYRFKHCMVLKTKTTPTFAVILFTYLRVVYYFPLSREGNYNRLVVCLELFTCMLLTLLRTLPYLMDLDLLSMPPIYRLIAQQTASFPDFTSIKYIYTRNGNETHPLLMRMCSNTKIIIGGCI